MTIFSRYSIQSRRSFQPCRARAEDYAAAARNLCISKKR